MEDFNPIGHTLEEVAAKHHHMFRGVAVVWGTSRPGLKRTSYTENFSLKSILDEHPELKDAVVTFTRTYFDQFVYQVKKETSHESQGVL